MSAQGDKRHEPSSAGALGAAAAAASGAGAAVVATVAAACCATPALAIFTVSLLGASGAATAAGLKPYAPWMLAGSALAIGYGFWARARAMRTCVPKGIGDRTVGARLASVVLWFALALWLAAVAANFLLRS